MKYTKLFLLLAAFIGVAAILFLTKRGATGHATHRSGPIVGDSAEIQKLQSDLAGTWKIEESTEPTSRNPKGSEGSGTEVWRTEKGGMPFVEEYHAKIGGEEADDTAYFWWDSTAKEIHGLWCADFNEEGCSNFAVKRAGQNWLMDGEFVSQESRIAWHEVFSKQGADAFTQTLDMARRGDMLKRASTIHGTRVK